MEGIISGRIKKTFCFFTMVFFIISLTAAAASAVPLKEWKEYKQGYTEGYKRGYSSGHNKGYNDGRDGCENDAAYSIKQVNALTVTSNELSKRYGKAYATGFRDGYKKGYEKGYCPGYNKGYASCDDT